MHDDLRRYTRSNLYKIVSYGSGLYGVEYADHPRVGIPESWGSKAHAVAYKAHLLGLTYEEYSRIAAPAHNMP